VPLEKARLRDPIRAANESERSTDEMREDEVGHGDKIPGEVALRDPLRGEEDSPRMSQTDVGEEYSRLLLCRRLRACEPIVPQRIRGLMGFDP
jgi:hypothetical protein